MGPSLSTNLRRATRSGAPRAHAPRVFRPGAGARALLSEGVWASAHMNHVPMSSHPAQRQIAVVLNLCCNVGTTTIATQLLAPRMPDARIYSITSTTAEGFGDFLENIVLVAEAIVDVAGPRCADFLQLMARYHTSRELFDVLGSKREVHSHPLRLAASAHGVLSAPLVDATFATDGLLPQDDAWATFE